MGLFSKRCRHDYVVTEEKDVEDLMKTLLGTAKDTYFSRGLYSHSTVVVFSDGFKFHVPYKGKIERKVCLKCGVCVDGFKDVWHSAKKAKDIAFAKYLAKKERLRLAKKLWTDRNCGSV